VGGTGVGVEVRDGVGDGDGVNVGVGKTFVQHSDSMSPSEPAGTAGWFTEAGQL
jgi:hypothetical protein